MGNEKCVFVNKSQKHTKQAHIYQLKMCKCKGGDNIYLKLG